MSMLRKVLVLPAFLAVIAIPIFSIAEEDIEDLIYIAKSDRKVTAVISGIHSSTIRLLPKEEVLWMDSVGKLGAMLTDHGFYIISDTSGSWRKFRLSSEESKAAIVTLSPLMALLATEDRAIGYNMLSNEFYETRLPLRDTIVALKSGENVAVLVMSSKVFGIKAKSSSFTEARLKIGETVEDVQVTKNKATVRTSNRLLTFISTDSMWKASILD